MVEFVANLDSRGLVVLLMKGSLGSCRVHSGLLGKGWDWWLRKVIKKLFIFGERKKIFK